jgi:hypothetical protein
VPLAGFYFWGGARAGFSTNRRGGYPPSTSPCYNQLSQGLTVPLPGRILVVLRELALAREREGRKRSLPYFHFHASFGWEARPKILEACGAGACFVAFSTIRLPSSSG